MNKILWVTGKNLEEEGKEWEIMGVFDTEQGAKDACKSSWDFIGPVTLNKRLPDESVPWEGAYYPLLTKSDENFEK